MTRIFKKENTSPSQLVKGLTYSSLKDLATLIQNNISHFSFINVIIQNPFQLIFKYAHSFSKSNSLPTAQLMIKPLAWKLSRRFSLDQHKTTAPP